MAQARCAACARHGRRKRGCRHNEPRQSPHAEADGSTGLIKKSRKWVKAKRLTGESGAGIERHTQGIDTAAAVSFLCIELGWGIDHSEPGYGCKAPISAVRVVGWTPRARTWRFAPASAEMGGMRTFNPNLVDIRFAPNGGHWRATGHARERSFSPLQNREFSTNRILRITLQGLPKWPYATGEGRSENGRGISCLLKTLL